MVEADRLPPSILDICKVFEHIDIIDMLSIGIQQQPCRWPLPLPSYLYNPANALGLSMEEKDLLFCTCIGRWPLPLPSYLCNPANALGLSIEEKDLLFCKRIGRWPLPLPSFILARGWVK